jgi:hypothetical protein
MHNNTDRTPEFVEDSFYESILTLRKLPSVRVQGYFNSWPGIVHTPQELMLMETRPTKILATPDAISRLEETLTWMQWVTVLERKLIWMRAAKTPWKIICQELGERNHVTAWRKWRRGLGKISTQLNNQKR